MTFVTRWPATRTGNDHGASLNIVPLKKCPLWDVGRGQSKKDDLVKQKTAHSHKYLWDPTPAVPVYVCRCDICNLELASQYSEPPAVHCVKLKTSLFIANISPGSFFFFFFFIRERKISSPFYSLEKKWSPFHILHSIYILERKIVYGGVGWWGGGVSKGKESNMDPASIRWNVLLDLSW